MMFLPELTKFLKTHGHIYTVRAYKYSYSHTNVLGVGRCELKYIKRIDYSAAPLKIVPESELEPYVAMSGFSSVASWTDVIRRFISLGHPMYLYEVKK